MSLPWTSIILDYVCPSLGCIMSAIMFAAPVQDLRRALKEGTLGCLNPLPWSIMTGNCLGWSAYGYCTKDPFVLASNLPGLILSIWLNSGAAKLQYYDSLRQQQVQHQQNDEEEDEEERTSHRSRNQEMIITVPQERMLLRILILWSCILVWAGWIQHSFSQASIVGICVNVNLVFFYGAPLESMSRVVQTKCSDSIHIPTMIMNWINTSFWMAYGFARMDPIIYVPNGIGLVLGVAQGILVCSFPRHRHSSISVDDSNRGLVDQESDSDSHIIT